MIHVHAKEQRQWDTEVVALWRPLLTWTIESNLPGHMSPVHEVEYKISDIIHKCGMEYETHFKYH